MADQPEPISLKKAAAGLVDPKNSIKAGVYVFHIGGWILLGLGAYTAFNFFFGKPNSNTQKQKLTSNVTVASGATVGTLITGGQEQHQEGNKRTVGLELSITADDSDLVFKKYFNDNVHAGLGVRWKYRHTDTKNDVLPVVRFGWDF